MCWRIESRAQDRTLIMVFNILHPCGVRVRFKAEDALRRPVCPRCRQPIQVSAWQKLCARVGGARSANVQSTGLRANVRSTASPDVVATLSRLARRAWTRGQSGHGSFLFRPSLLLPRDEASRNDAVRALYGYARSCADGLNIPYHVPLVSVTNCSDDAAGRFAVDEDGWTSIEISRDFLDTPRAVWLIMAHELCHHILEMAGLAGRHDRLANERQTDRLMFVCGFGQLAKDGYESTRQVQSAYVRSHLGYLTAAEHRAAFEWVIAARCANQLGGMEDLKPQSLGIADGFEIQSNETQALQKLALHIVDSSARQRLLQYYRGKHPHLSLVDLVQIIVDDYARDRS